MLHDRLNELRTITSDAEPLRCDPDLREIARDHRELYLLKKGGGDQLARGSRSGTIDRIRSLGGRVVNPREVVRQGNIRTKPAEERYEEVCENPRERRRLALPALHEQDKQR